MEVNRVLRLWAEHRGVRLADAYAHFREQLDDAEWEARQTPNLHVDEAGYRMMGELIFETLPAP